MIVHTPNKEEIGTLVQKMINEGATVVTVKKSENLLNRWVINGK